MAIFPAALQPNAVPAPLDEAPIVVESALAGACHYVITALAVLYTLAFFLLRWIAFSPLRWTAAAFRRAGVSFGLPRFAPYWVVATGTMTPVLILFDDHAGESGNWSALALVSVALLLNLSVFVINASAIDQLPPTLGDLLRIVGSRWPERWFARRLLYPQDAYFIRIMINNTLVALPGWVAIMLFDATSAGAAWCFAFFWVTSSLTPSHEAVDHWNMHNHLFRPAPSCSGWEKRCVHLGEYYLRYFLNPLCMRIPNHYRVQHLYIHHVEDNGPEDNQSTLHYDRASFFDFCRSALQFGFSWAFCTDVAIYLARKRKIRQLRSLLFGLAIWYGALTAIAIFSWQAAAAIFVIKLLRGPPASVNIFSWHALVDIDDHTNVYRNTVNMTPLSRDGITGGSYHIEHHLYPGKRWDAFAAYAQANEANHVRQGAIQFWKQGWFGFPFLQTILAQRFDLLAAHCLRVGEYDLNEEEIASVIRERLRPLHRVRRSSLYLRCDAALGQFVAHTLIWERLRPPDAATSRAIHAERKARRTQAEGYPATV